MQTDGRQCGDENDARGTHTRPKADFRECRVAGFSRYAPAGQRHYPTKLLKLNAADSAALFRALADEEVVAKRIFIQRNHGCLTTTTVAGEIGAGYLKRVLDLA